ncbi:hypothetical protein ACQP1G_24950 [Nocardia sp. CA-107356]|uniref:hypothetical protein n=1 Tax=Nocardia sp. CA-107356 TaxID=3239972 RepID=UPI003D907926
MTVGRGRSEPRTMRRSASTAVVADRWTDDTNTSGTFTTSTLKSAAPTGRYPPMAGTTAVGAVVYLLATAIEEGRDLSSMSGILADSSYRLLPA